MEHPRPMLDWTQIRTVMLDMDGCLLDLIYDNRLWNDLVPTRYGQARGISADEAHRILYGHLLGGQRDLDFYCIDFWRRRTQLDIMALHQEMAHFIIYRPGAQAFLHWLGGQGGAGAAGHQRAPRQSRGQESALRLMRRG